MKMTKIALLVLFATLTGAASAHDTDIYVNNASGSTAGEPLVMFSMDLRPNVLNASGCSGSKCNNISAYFPSGVTTSNATKLDVYIASLSKVFASTSGVKVGLMIPHNQGTGKSCTGPSASTCTNGGYILMGFQELQSSDTNGAKALFKTKLTDLKLVPAGTNNYNGHPFQPDEMFFEFFRYLTGQAYYNMKNGWTDFATNSTYNIDSTSDQEYASLSPAAAPLSWDSTIVSGSNYISPITAACQRVYTINFTFGTISQDSDSDTAIQAAKTAGGLGISLSDAKKSPFEILLSTLQQTSSLADGSYNSSLNIANSNTNVTSFFLTPGPSNTQNKWASAGSGGSVQTAFDLDQDPDVLVAYLQSLFSQILSVSTTFVSPSVAVNVYNRAQVLNDVYIAMFQALGQPGTGSGSTTGNLAWPGNVKKLNIGLDSAGNLQLQDINGSNAVGSDGRIDYNAISYWTDTTTLPASTNTFVTSYDKTGADGRNVRLGGAGSRIPGFFSSTPATSPALANTSSATSLSGPRKVFTEPSGYSNGTPTTLMDLNADTTTANALYSPTNYFTYDSTYKATSVGTCTTADTSLLSACNLIMYVRGIKNSSGTMVVRNYNQPDWFMGDTLHSRPLAINYGINNGSATTYGTKNPDVRVLVGGNDGLMHMFRNTVAGNVDPSTTSSWKSPSPTGYQDGVEAWAFMPREVMNIVPILANDPNSYSHPYGVDGSPAVYVYDANGDGNIDPTTDKVYLYFGLRRGGKAYYAMDITSPDSPKMLWKIVKGAAGTDFAELGQTWSTPRIGMMLYGGSTTPRPVVIFGGGYDPNKDDNSTGHSAAAGGNDSQGNAIFVVSATDGSLIWKAVYGASTGYNATSKAYSRPDMLDSIPANVTVVDSDSNGLIDRLYVGDTGGVLWRVDAQDKDQAQWSATPVLSIGRHYSTSASDDRRFFNAPDYVQTVDSDGTPFDAVVIGTGDRENPLGTTVSNWMYMFKDYNVSSGSPPTTLATHSMLTDVTSDCYQNSPGTCTPVDTYGWRMQLNCPPSMYTPCGEKDLSGALTYAGTVYFTTYIPATTSATCGPAEGTGRIYEVSLQDGSAVEDLYSGNNTSSGTLFVEDRSKQLASGGIPSEVVSVGGGNILLPDLSFTNNKAKAGMKTFWFQKEGH